MQDDDSTSLDETIDNYIERLIDAKGLTGLVGEEREEAAARMKRLFLEALNMSILDALPRDKQDEIFQISDTESDPVVMKEKIDAIVVDAGLDMEGITVKTAQGFAETYLKES
jgi:hypothetical protein